VQKPGDFARRICDRHYGAVAMVLPLLVLRQMRTQILASASSIPTASEAGLSGNGTRCAAAYLYYQNLWSADELRFEDAHRNQALLPRET
jgi:diaminopimelate epimerase